MKHLFRALIIISMKILMVCLGNICRSPLAEGILLEKIKERNLSWEVDSAGTSGWHQGELPDTRSIAVAKAHGIELTYQRSRQFKMVDFEEFDLILAMDSSNYSNIARLATTERQKDKVKLILNYTLPLMKIEQYLTLIMKADLKKSIKCWILLAKKSLNYIFKNKNIYRFILRPVRLLYFMSFKNIFSLNI